MASLYPGSVLFGLQSKNAFQEVDSESSCAVANSDDPVQASPPNAQKSHLKSSIRSKLVLSLAVTFVLLLLINEAIQSIVLAPELANPEIASEIFWLARRSFVLFCVSVLLLQMLMIQRIVVQPLSELKKHIANVSLDSTSNKPHQNIVQHRRDDEIGDLAKTFDQTFDRLAAARREISRASVASGRSEVAATVIHNVGNVLTNVNSLVETASDQISSLRIEPLHQLADRLSQHSDDTDLLDATPEYLHRLAAKLENDQNEISQLLQSLNGNVRHIHDVIRDQRRHTSQEVQIESVNIRDLVSEAIDCCHARLDKDSIKVTVTGDQRKRVSVDRSLALQTMINIIANAGYATVARRKTERLLRINIESDAMTTSISFQDNGCGMDQDTLKQVFNAHFTKRKDGSGLGLHFCAIAAKRYGGSITAASDGIGLGSTMTLLLPTNPESRNSAANPNQAGCDTAKQNPLCSNQS